MDTPQSNYIYVLYMPSILKGDRIDKPQIKGVYTFCLLFYRAGEGVGLLDRK